MSVPTAIPLAAAALLALAMAAVHSWLGGRALDAAGIGAGGTARIVRAAWHLPSLAWLGAAAIMARLAGAPLDATGAEVLLAIGGTFAASAVLNLVWLRGRHVAWPLFALAALGAWVPAIRFYGWADAVRAGAGVGAAAALAAAAALHFYWAAGGRAGQGAAVPERDGRPAFAPGRRATFVLAVALLVAAALPAALLRWAAVPMPGSLLAAACWVLALLFTARAIGDFRYVGFFKRIRGSRFAALDSAAYSPICFLLGLALADVAWR